MSPEFVRYTAEIETIDPHIDELLAQIVAFWEKKGHESPTKAPGGPSAVSMRNHSVWSRQRSRSWPMCSRPMRRALIPVSNRPPCSRTSACAMPSSATRSVVNNTARATRPSPR